MTNDGTYQYVNGHSHAHPHGHGNSHGYAHPSGVQSLPGAIHPSQSFPSPLAHGSPLEVRSPESPAMMHGSVSAPPSTTGAHSSSHPSINDIDQSIAMLHFGGAAASTPQPSPSGQSVTPSGTSTAGGGGGAGAGGSSGATHAGHRRAVSHDPSTHTLHHSRSTASIGTVSEEGEGDEEDEMKSVSSSQRAATLTQKDMQKLENRRKFEEQRMATERKKQNERELKKRQDKEEAAKIEAGLLAKFKL